MLSLMRYGMRVRAPAAAAARRQMAIAATVKTAPDTSKMDFPAPSHVSVAGEAADLTRQLRAFYSSPDSAVELSAEARAGLLDDLSKRATSIPDTTVTTDWVESNVKIPSKIRLGDNPVYEGMK